jgi:hypothetical protein
MALWYDEDAKPIYRNIYLNMLGNDGITLGVLKALVT